MSRNLVAYYSEGFPDRVHSFVQPSGRFVLTADFTAGLAGRTITQASWRSWLSGEHVALSDAGIAGGKVTVTVSPGWSSVLHYGALVCTVTLSDGTTLEQAFCSGPDARYWRDHGQVVSVTA